MVRIDHYTYRNKFITENFLEKGIARTCLEAHKNLPFVDRIKDNLKKEICERRFGYLKYSIKYYLEGI